MTCQRESAYLVDSLGSLTALGTGFLSDKFELPIWIGRDGLWMICVSRDGVGR